ncbi:group II intron reverse transcriptase/maturase [Pasteuria penetrans]|uniref:group II intron reverse transcriptase/maturase n=1 Tax=Pasteuria penetrans TaxID=86005 RepID=UPI000FA1DAD4|nr:group II intron reverse transcriptase/maturase [Pasteuria penetrans]
MEQATSDRNPSRYNIQKKEVLEAWHQVLSNGGGPGVDQQTITAFAYDLRNNLYVIWNQLCAGSYFPSKVRRVWIPKSCGGKRPLGIPTVADRVAQTVLKNRLESLLEPLFHEDSYGCRPQRSAHQALRVTRERCWQYDWGIDLDIVGFFDNIPHHLILRALKHFGADKATLRYCKRWLKAPVLVPDGSSQERSKGTPQGGVISPLLANLFLHCVFDQWMETKHLDIRFARYVDDVIVHCRNKAQAKYLLLEIRQRMAECGLELHPEKTKIFYCEDDRQSGNHDVVSFDFLGYTFGPRKVSSRRTGVRSIGFVPAISQKSKSKIARQVGELNIPGRVGMDLEEIANLLRAQLVGWITYYGAFYPSAVRYFLRDHMVISLFRL